MSLTSHFSEVSPLSHYSVVPKDATQPISPLGHYVVHYCLLLHSCFLPMIGLLGTSVTMELGRLAPVAWEARGNWSSKVAGAVTLSQLWVTLTLSPHLGRGAALPFPESTQGHKKARFLQIHSHVILIFLLLTCIKQTNNSA